MDQTSILFVHIPKTAGTSVKSLLRTRFDQADILTISQGGIGWPKMVAKVDDFQLVVGHVGFGFVNAFRRRPDVVTFLRDPIERAISTYCFMRQIDISCFANNGFQGESRLIQEHATIRAKELCLRDFIRTEPELAAAYLGNLQTAYLCSTELCRRSSGDLQADDLPRAQQNLESCRSFGLVERLDDSMELLNEALGWEPFAGVPHANSTRTRLSVSDLDQPTIDALRELTRLDGELYRFASRLFDERRQALQARPAAQNPAVARGTSLSISENSAGDDPVFTFDRAIPGNGWYGAERVANRWCSWTGPTCESSIHLKSLAHRDSLLSVRVVHALKPEILHGTQLLVNGELLATRVCQQAEGYALEAAVPANLIAAGDGAARILIRVPEVHRPCDLDSTSVESRRLGLLVAGIAFAPAA